MKWFYILLTIPSLGHAQMTAFFETSFYLEDALGNQDTIILGHDIDANTYYNPEFGEMDISQPWDSIFEVRAAHFVDWNSSSENLILSKKIIGDNEGGVHPVYGCLWFNEAIIIFIHINHFPLTVSWDQNVFENSYCLNRSVLTPHMLPIVSEFWYEGLQPGIDYVCLAESSSFQVNQFVFDNFGFYLIDSLQGSSIDTIAAMLFYPKYQDAFESPCTSTVSVSDLKTPESPVILYPNPTNGFLTIHEGDEYGWAIFDPISNKLQQGYGSLVDVSGFESGVHLISIYNEDRKNIYKGKFVKLNK